MPDPDDILEGEEDDGGGQPTPPPVPPTPPTRGGALGGEQGGTTDTAETVFRQALKEITLRDRSFLPKAQALISAGKEIWDWFELMTPLNVDDPAQAEAILAEWRGYIINTLAPMARRLPGTLGTKEWTATLMKNLGAKEMLTGETPAQKVAREYREKGEEAQAEREFYKPRGYVQDERGNWLSPEEWDVGARKEAERLFQEKLAERKESFGLMPRLDPVTAAKRQMEQAGQAAQRRPTQEQMEEWGKLVAADEAMRVGQFGQSWRNLAPGAQPERGGQIGAQEGGYEAAMRMTRESQMADPNTAAYLAARASAGELLSQFPDEFEEWNAPRAAAAAPREAGRGTYVPFGAPAGYQPYTYRIPPVTGREAIQTGPPSYRLPSPPGVGLPAPADSFEDYLRKKYPPFRPPVGRSVFRYGR